MRALSRICIGLLLVTCGSSPIHAQPVQGVLFDLNMTIAVQTATVAGDVPPPIASPKVRDLVFQILDDRIPVAKRQDLIRRNPELAGDLIGGLTDELTPGTAEEYRRIPWIWRIALGAGTGKDPVIMRAVLEEALPEPNQPLHAWRAAVVGGGIIHGLSQQDLWPLERMQELLLDQKALELRWQMAVAEAAKVIEDEKEPIGARHDAMRMLGLGPWHRYGPQLARYLQMGVHPDLQMGAIGAVADMDHAGAVAALMKGLPHFSEKNRQLAIHGLLRGEVRQKTLIEGLEQGSVRPAWLTLEQREKLMQVADSSWRDRAAIALKK